MDDFIEKIRKHPCLWDVSSLTYRDVARKDLIWETVAKECGILNGKDAKNQWKRLRDSHREALRRRKTTTGQTAINSRPWKYEHCMEFLLPQSFNRETSTSATSYSTIVDNDIIERLQEVDIPSSGPAASVIDDAVSMPNQSQSNHCLRKRNKVLTILEERELKRERREIYRDGLRRQILEHITSERDRPRDALSDLFSSFCEKTRELPKYLQLRVQREIFNSVNRAEEESLHNENYNPQHST